MDEWFRWIVGGLLGLMTTVGAFITHRIFRLVDSKPNVDSTNRRFDETLATIRSHIDRCDLKADKQQDTLDAIRADVADTKIKVAVLAQKVEP